MPPAPVPIPRDPAARVVVLSRPGCHLCELAEEVVAQVCAELDVSWEAALIDASPSLLEAYAEQIPVTFVDGRQHVLVQAQGTGGGEEGADPAAG